VTIDPSTAQKHRLDVARFQIQTSSWSIINKSFNVNIDGLIFKIHIWEEPFDDLFVEETLRGQFLDFEDNHSDDSSDIPWWMLEEDVDHDVGSSVDGLMAENTINENHGNLEKFDSGQIMVWQLLIIMVLLVTRKLVKLMEFLHTSSVKIFTCRSTKISI
jgi:hypothetical protein